MRLEREAVKLEGEKRLHLEGKSAALTGRRWQSPAQQVSLALGMGPRSHFGGRRAGFGVAVPAPAGSQLTQGSVSSAALQVLQGECEMIFFLCFQNIKQRWWFRCWWR